MSGYERENRNVMRLCLKTASDGVTLLINKQYKFYHFFSKIYDNL